MMNSICIAILVFGLNSNDYKTRELTALSVVNKDNYSEHNLWYLYDNFPDSNVRDYIEKIINARTPKFNQYPMIVHMELRAYDCSDYNWGYGKYYVGRIREKSLTGSMIVPFLKERFPDESYHSVAKIQRIITYDFINHIRWKYRVRPEVIKLWIILAIENAEKEQRSSKFCGDFSDLIEDNNDE